MIVTAFPTSKSSRPARIPTRRTSPPQRVSATRARSRGHRMPGAPWIREAQTRPSFPTTDAKRRGRIRRKGGHGRQSQGCFSPRRGDGRAWPAPPRKGWQNFCRTALVPLGRSPIRLAALGKAAGAAFGVRGEAPGTSLVSASAKPNREAVAEGWQDFCRAELAGRAARS